MAPYSVEAARARAPTAAASFVGNATGCLHQASFCFPARNRRMRKSLLTGMEPTETRLYMNNRSHMPSGRCWEADKD
ncbi:uncharacterized protein LOC144178910 isoform X2 [Haemaphysalis longicornis]